MFNNPLAYHQGYQPANVPPPYGNNEPARFAQFDANGFTRGGSPAKHDNVGEDSLPHMPSWDNAASKRVLDDKSALAEAEHVEMGRLDHSKEQKLPMMANASVADLSLSHPGATHSRTNTSTTAIPRIAGPAGESYTGPDFSTPVGRGTDTSYGGAGLAHPAPSVAAGYTGPDFMAPKSYAAYAPSESTKYEPSTFGVNEPNTPGVLQAGRRVEGHGAAWKEV